jgi:hypothetical protein
MGMEMEKGKGRGRESIMSVKMELGFGDQIWKLATLFRMVLVRLPHCSVVKRLMGSDGRRTRGSAVESYPPWTTWD